MIKIKLKERSLSVQENNIKVEKLLLKLGFNPEDVLILKDGKLITEDKVLKDGDEIEIIEVVSQG